MLNHSQSFFPSEILLRYSFLWVCDCLIHFLEHFPVLKSIKTVNFVTIVQDPLTATLHYKLFIPLLSSLVACPDSITSYHYLDWKLECEKLNWENVTAIESVYSKWTRN